jgi:hypothetical protein
LATDPRAPNAAPDWSFRSLDTVTVACRIDLRVVAVLSLPMAVNGIDPVQRIEIVNPTRIAGARVRVEVTGPDGPLAAPVEVVADLAGTTVLTDVPVRLDPAAMTAPTEQRGRVSVSVWPAEIRDAAADLAEPLGSATADVRVLAGRGWVSTPTLLGLELLSAFVQPQDPALDRPLTAASARLAVTTGRADLDGATADPERIDAVAGALFEAVAATGVRLVAAPPTVDDQLVRTAGEVLEGLGGTSLDLAVLYAALLERAGLAPVLWVTSDEVLAGYWREPHALAATATTEVGVAANLVDLAYLRIVRLDPGLDFAHAVADPVADLVGRLGHRSDGATVADADPAGRVIGVVDVRQGRRDGIRALPVRTVAADGTVALIEHRPTELPAVRAIAPDPADPAGPKPASGPVVPARVEQWKNGLLDLSLRNRLLNYSGRSGISLTVPEGQLDALEDVVNAGSAVTLLPSDRLADVHRAQGLRRGTDLPPDQLAAVFTGRTALFTDVAGESYPARLRALAYKARTIVEETGANNLYLTLGTLRWQLDGKDLTSPLVLVPVQLVARNRGVEYRMVLDEAGTSTPNFCLLEKLRQVHGLSVPGLAEPATDDTGIDLAAALHGLRTALAAAGLPYRVEETADLAVLAFAKFRLWRDLTDSWSELARNPLVSHLIRSPTESFVDPVAELGPVDLDELATRCPVPADGSQLAAIADAVAGRTFVLEGPPGTGKSQTITNLLTRAVAEGRRVLFVAEKRAALDVVTRRLVAVGLGPFCLDLHDKAARPAVIRSRVKAALDHHVSFDRQGMRVQSEVLDSARRRLAAYARALHEPDAAGLSYYSAHTAALAVEPGTPRLDVPIGLVTAPGAVSRIRAALGTLIDDADPARPRPDHPWGFVDPVAPLDLDQTAVHGAAITFDHAVAVPVTSVEAAEVLPSATSPAELEALSTFASAWAQNLALLDETGSDAWRATAAGLLRAAHDFVSVRHPALDKVEPSALDLDVEGLHERAVHAADSSWFGRRRRHQAVIDVLAVALRSPVSRSELTALTGELVDLRRTIRALGERASALPGLNLPVDWNPLTEAGSRQLDDQIGWYEWASDAVRVTDGLGRPLPEVAPFTRALRSFVARAATVSSADRVALTGLAQAAVALRAATATPDGEFTRWAGSSGLLARWRATAATRDLADSQARTLRRWLALVAHLEPLRTAGATQARRALLDGSVSADDAVRAFDAGTVDAALAERADATGLEAFEPSIHNRYVQRFTASSSTVRADLVGAIPDALLAARSFDADGVLGRIGELRRELVKQRRGLAVRGLLTHYGDLITAIMPCVLVSPDSLARFFTPQADQFDLVVFDEASQIRVADAVGAMGRARSVVVVGDSRQMPPTSFAEPSWNDDEIADGDDGLAVPDEESILTECIQAGVQQQWLSWHYRSQDESLIAFSNRHYYSDRLSSFPGPVTGPADPSPAGHGISLVRVDGEFQRSTAGKSLRTNPIEAVAVITEIRRRFAETPDTVPSIGVVTFNIQQRNHIEALLRDLGDERITAALDRTDGEGLFVKNLENVQGDERDAIFFSTAFSVDRNGRLPLNFGPLNRVGGERRLNVAITRARRQVLVFCSFDPQQLRAEETSSIGIRHLRAYLDLAARGTAALAPRSRPATVDRHRDQIATTLAERGLEVRTEVGLSDFTLDLVLATPAPADPASSGPRVAVLLDGPDWAARRTVGDRDGLPVTVLGGLMHWPAVERVWMPEWLADPDAVVDRLVAVTRNPPAGGAPPDPTPEAPPPAGTLGSSAGVPSAQLAGETLFLAWQPAPAGPRELVDNADQPDAAHRVWEVLVAGIEAEAPIHRDRLVRLAATAFDTHRLTADRRTAIAACLPPGLPPDPDGEPFLWPLGLDPLTWDGFRRSADDERPIDAISLTEWGNAIVALCRAGAGMTADQLRLATIRVFGFARRTPERDARVDAAAATMIERGRLRRDDDGLLQAR